MMTSFYFWMNRQNAWSRLVFIFNQLEKGSLGQRSEEGLNPLLIGTYAVVKEAVHISTGKYYACKVINKRLMEGREHMVGRFTDSILLKQISIVILNQGLFSLSRSGTKSMSSRRSLLATPTSSLFTTLVHNPLNYNMLTSFLLRWYILIYRKYFETLNNLYLVTDLCQGGELFDRICAKGQYYERDARHLVKVVLNAVEYLHSHGIVHRGESPLDLLLRSYQAQPPGNSFIKTVI